MERWKGLCERKREGGMDGLQSDNGDDAGDGALEEKQVPPALKSAVDLEALQQVDSYY
jgi:hypothetical protein